MEDNCLKLLHSDAGSTPAASTINLFKSLKKLSGKLVTNWSLKYRRDYLSIFLACFAVAIVAMLFIGCASARPAQKLEAFAVEKVTVFCTPPGWVAKHWDRTVGKMAYGEAYAMIDGWNHIYIPCIEVDGKLMPEDQNALGHEVWHLFNRTRPDRIMNPDE